MSSLCVICKGAKALCGQESCPILAKRQVYSTLSKKIDGSFSGPSPSVFIGRQNYPHVWAGPMVTDFENPYRSDTPKEWFSMGVDDIVTMRAHLFRSELRADAKKPSRLWDALQEIALSVRPVDTEVVLEGKPKFNVGFDAVTAPIGPSGQVKYFDLTSNPKIPKSVDSVVNDEIGAEQGMWSLYERGLEVSSISTILSAGTLGFDKRLVPTRWAITAVDSSLSLKLTKEIKQYPLLGEYLLFSSENFDNHYEVLLLPSKWSFEQLEVYLPGGLWTQDSTDYEIISDYEGYRGRTKYADNVSGAYYSGKLAVCEYLSAQKRQGACIIFREIKPGYVVPLGVWQVRENVRNAMRSKPEKFQTLGEVFCALTSRLKVPLEAYRKQSELLKKTESQRVLSAYIANTGQLQV